MKKNRKWITIILTLCMIVGLFAVTASAEQPKLLILGDSIASGFGLDKYIENAGDPSSVVDGFIIEGSYAYLVAQEVGAEALPHAHGGWRASDFVNVLNGVNYEDLDLVSQKLIAGLGSVMPNDIQQEMEEERTALPTAIANADYISVNFGANDIYTYSLTTAVMARSGQLLSLGLPDFKNIRSFNDLSVAVSALFSIPKDIFALLSDLEDGFDAGLANYEAAFPVMVEYIASHMKPGAKLLINTVACPVKLNINVSEDIALKLRTKSDAVAAEANRFMKKIIAEYDNVYLVDTTGAEYFTIKDVDISVLKSGKINLREDKSEFLSFMRLVHPNEHGHEQIAQEILETIYSSGIKPAVTVDYNIFGQVQVKWEKIDGAESYIVYRASEVNGPFISVNTSSGTNWTDTLAPTDSTLYYKVAAAMDSKGYKLTEKSDAVEFSTVGQSVIGKMLTNILNTLVTIIENTLRAPLEVTKIVSDVFKINIGI